MKIPAIGGQAIEQALVARKVPTLGPLRPKTSQPVVLHDDKGRVFLVDFDML